MEQQQQRGGAGAAAGARGQQQEEKEQQQQQTPQKSAAAASGGAPPVLSPSQIARAHITYARQQRPVDTSRQHSLYAATFTAQPLQAFSKLGRGYFASHNKSYIRSCMQDPGYGFQLETLKSQAQNDPNMLNFAAEITREHQEPERRLTSIISPVNQPDTTHHKGQCGSCLHSLARPHAIASSHPPPTRTHTHTQAPGRKSSRARTHVSLHCCSLLLPLVVSLR